MANKLSAPLDRISDQFETASSSARALVESIPPDLLGRRPDANSWSIAECIAHLTLTTDAYLPAIREALDEGRQRRVLQSRAGFRMGFAARMLAWWLEPPYRLKSRTPAAFVPSVENPASALPDFLERQQQLSTLLAGADGLALDRLAISSPFARRMRYNVYAAFRLIAVHERRHLWQAEQVRRKLLTRTPSQSSTRRPSRG